MEPKTNYIVSVSPHIKAAEGTADIMRWVCVALGPAFGVALYTFGWYSLAITLICVGSCVLTEALCQRLRKAPVTVSDFSAVVTGLLLAATLPPNVSWWVPVVGGVFAIAIVKQAFGGLGSNIWNPALMARAFLQVSLPTQLNSPVWPYLRDKGQDVVQRISVTMDGTFGEYAKFSGGGAMNLTAPAFTQGQVVQNLPDVVSGATQLTQLKQMTVSSADVIKNGATLQDLFPGGAYLEQVWNSFIGIEGGCIAEVSAAALLLGGIFLLLKKIITWEAPVFYLGTIALLAWVLPAPVHVEGGAAVYTAWFTGPVLLHLVGGGVVLAAFFMDTDYVTTPMTRSGKIIFAVGCGVITVMIRLYSSAYPEGCCYSILIMNTCVPLIDNWTRPRKFGLKKIAA